MPFIPAACERRRRVRYRCGGAPPVPPVWPPFSFPVEIDWTLLSALPGGWNDDFSGPSTITLGTGIGPNSSGSPQRSDHAYPGAPVTVIVEVAHDAGTGELDAGVALYGLGAGFSSIGLVGAIDDGAGTASVYGRVTTGNGPYVGPTVGPSIDPSDYSSTVWLALSWDGTDMFVYIYGDTGGQYLTASTPATDGPFDTNQIILNATKGSLSMFYMDNTAMIETDIRAVVTGWGYTGGAPTPPPVTPYPLTLGWAHAYWAEGPEFVALATPDTDPVQIIPDEIGTANLVAPAPANEPIYSAAYAPLNAQPAFDADGASWASAFLPALIAQPFTAVVVIEGVEPSQWIADFGNPWIARLSDGWYINAAGSPLGPGGGEDAGSHMIIAEYNGANSRIIVDGTTVAIGNCGTGNAAQAGWFGVDAALGMTGASPFLGLAPGLFSNAEKTALVQWSSDHYGSEPPPS